jgi:hypothetical protein
METTMKKEQKRILKIFGLAMIAGIICCTVIHLNECTVVQPCFDLPKLKEINDDTQRIDKIGSRQNLQNGKKDSE